MAGTQNRSLAMVLSTGRSFSCISHQANDDDGFAGAGDVEDREGSEKISGVDSSSSLVSPLLHLFNITVIDCEM